MGPTSDAPLMHITTRGQWAEAQAAGRYAPPSLSAEGFIHLSGEHQVVGTANRFYRDASDLVVLCLRTADLEPHLRWEEGEPGVLFPHLYAALNAGSVVGLRELVSGERGWVGLSPMRVV